MDKEMTNPIPQYRVTMHYKKSAAHQGWSVELYDENALADFLTSELLSNRIKSVKIRKL